MKIRLALCGAGNRGRFAYGPYAIKHPERCSFVAVAEPIDERRNAFSKQHNIPAEMQFKDWKEMLDAKVDAEAIMICMQDQMHVKPALMSLDLGYDVLLEKPMAEKLEDCIAIANKVKETGRILQICHVLRYTPFWNALNDFIQSGKLGKIMVYTHRENVAYFHYAHSFVRGNWRNSDLSSPMILAKSCHDLDLIYWLTGSKPAKISSFGALNHLKSDQAPEGATKRCKDCPLEATCKYSAYKIYAGLPFKHLVANAKNTGFLGFLGRISLNHPTLVKVIAALIPAARVGLFWNQWPTTTITDDLTPEGVKKAIDEGPYGRCVWHCDNNVVDNQLINIECEDGTRINFAMHGFSMQEGRTIRIDGTKGVLLGEFLGISETITFQEHDTGKIHTVFEKGMQLEGHGGGDFGLMNSFLSLLEKKRSNPDAKISSLGKTNAFESLESHLIAFAAEKSRLTDKTIIMNEFKKKNGL